MPKIGYSPVVIQNWSHTGSQSLHNIGSLDRTKNDPDPGEVDTDDEHEITEKVTKKAVALDNQYPVNKPGSASQMRLRKLFGNSTGTKDTAYLAKMTAKEVDDAVHDTAADMPSSGEFKCFYRGLTMEDGKEPTEPIHAWLHNERGAPAISSVLDKGAVYGGSHLIEIAMYRETSEFFGAKVATSPYTASQWSHHEFRPDDDHEYVETERKKVDLATYACLTKQNFLALHKKFGPDKCFTVIKIACRGKLKEGVSADAATSFIQKAKNTKTLFDIRLTRAKNLPRFEYAIKNDDIDTAASMFATGEIDVTMRHGNGHTPFATVVAKGNIDLVRQMLENKPCKLNQKHISNALLTAVHGGHEKVTQFLLTKKADPNVITAHGNTALHIAATRGKSSLIKLLLDNGADINKPDKDGYTVLHRAVEGNSDAVIMLLLERGADPYATNASGDTALKIAKQKKNNDHISNLIEMHIICLDTLCDAVKKNDIDTVRGLVKETNVNMPNRNGQMLLSLAVQNAFEDQRMAILLLEKGADPQNKNIMGERLINIAVLKGIGGNHDLIKLMLDKGADARTMLRAAIKSNNSSVVEFLLERGFNLDEITPTRTPHEIINIIETHAASLETLKNAVKNNRIDEVRQHLTANNINTRDKDSRTLLSHATEKGHADIVAILLEKGADPHATDIKTDRTPLMNAAYQGDQKSVNLLLDKGVNIDTANRTGWTALNSAADQGHIDIVQLLLERKADPNACSPLIKALNRNYSEVAQLLLKQHADPNQADANGCTPLNMAAMKGHEDAVKQLLKLGADANSVRSSRRTALYDAAKNGHTGIIRLLLENGAHINTPNIDGATPLHQAVFNGHTQTVNLLLERGVNINLATNSTGNTPFHLAADNGHIDIVKLLLEKGVDINLPTKNSGATALHLAADKSRIGMVKLLLEKGADINLPKKNSGATALHLAADKGRIGMVKLLLEKGVDINLPTKDSGATAFHLAIDKGYIGIAKLLLESKANINDPNANELTPLAAAADHNLADMALFLIQNGAEINTPDNNGQTALYHATDKGHLEMVQFLIGCGADTQKPDSKGNTPEKIAISKSHDRIAHLLAVKKERKEREEKQSAVQPKKTTASGSNFGSGGFFKRVFSSQRTSSASIPDEPGILMASAFEQLQWLQKLNSKRAFISDRQVLELNDFTVQQFIKHCASDGSVEDIGTYFNEIDHLINHFKLKDKHSFGDMAYSLKKEVFSAAIRMATSKHINLISSYQALPYFPGKDHILIDVAKKQMNEDVKRHYSLPEKSPADKIKRITGGELKNLSQGEIVLHTMHLFNLENLVTEVDMPLLKKSITTYIRQTGSPCSPDEIGKKLVKMKYKEAIPYLLEQFPAPLNHPNSDEDKNNLRNFHPASAMLQLCSGFIFHPNYAGVGLFINPESAYSFNQISKNMACKFFEAKHDGQMETFFKEAFSRTDPCYEAASQLIIHYGNPEPIIISSAAPAWVDGLDNTANVDGLLSWLDRELLSHYAKQESIDLIARSEKEIDKIQLSEEYASYLISHETLFKETLRKAANGRVPQNELDTMALQYLNDGLKFAEKHAAKKAAMPS
jgi:ankyrin repeat protein